MVWSILGVLAIASLAASAQSPTPMDLNEQGVQASGRGDYAQAQAFYERSITGWRALGPDYAAHLGSTLLNLGQALSAQGRRREAVKAYEEALALERSSLGPSHIRTLMTMNYLGATDLMLGNIDRASALFQEALPLLRAHYPNDTELAHTLAGLAALRIWTGHVEEANPLAEEALSLTVKNEGEDSLDAALMYATVAESHRAAGRPDRAEPLYRKAIAIYGRQLGPDHPRVAQTRSQEALVLMNEGKLALAEQELRQATSELAKSCPACYAEQWNIETNLGILRSRQGKYKEADRLLAHALELQEQHSEIPGPPMAATLRSLAEVRRQERRYDDADRLSRRAASIFTYR